MEIDAIEQDRIQREKDFIFGEKEMVRTDGVIDKHVSSLAHSKYNAEYTFEGYMKTFLEMNKILWTDKTEITILQDNVHSLFNLQSRGDEVYYSFKISRDINGTGILKIFFDTEGSKDVVVYCSMEIKKPHEENYQ